MMRVLTAFVLMLVPVVATAIPLQWPVACTLGEDCFLQNLVDHDTSPAARDYRCGPATYDTHNGTDIRLRNLAAMRAGVAVRAAADGTVLGARDGVDDISIREGGLGAVKDRECGNGVHLQHAGGYRTQYCHLRKGSIAVATGQNVKAGDTLGMIGLSGQTEFPHVHFTVWKGRMLLDPFTAGPMDGPCSATAPSGQLWAVLVPYQQPALLNAGFTDVQPERKTMRDTPMSVATLPADAPALLYWADIMGVRTGDMLTFTITAPDGTTWAEKTIAAPKALASYFAFIGKKNAAGMLATGDYSATVTLERGGRRVLHATRKVSVQ
jgi:murein DD-endopeptidase MepM/ murein hydrolase activator NlpD